MHQGNQTATPEYTLQMVEKSYDASTDFAIACTRYLDNQGEQTDVINSASNFAQAVSQLLHNTKGVSRLAADDDTLDEIILSAKNSAECCQQFFTKMISSNAAMKGKPQNQRSGIIAEANREMTEKLSKMTLMLETLIPKAAEQVANMQGDIGDMVDQEMGNAARMIEAALARLAELQERPLLKVHSAILESAMAMTNAISHLIKCATASQQEIVAHGRGRSTDAEFYKKNNRWTEGLISAAKAVAAATNLLVETADGVIQGTHSFEQLIVASNEIAAATAQLVAASRVKAISLSKTQDRLEDAAKDVNAAARALVKAVKVFAAKEIEERERESYNDMTPYEFKKKEMEKQVEILKLEKELGVARKMLGELRRLGYHDEEGAI